MSNRCSDRGASGTGFQTSIPECYFGDGHLAGHDFSRKIGSGDPSSSRKTIVNVGRGSDHDPRICRVFGSNRRSDTKVYHDANRGIYDCGRVWKGRN